MRYILLAATLALISACGKQNPLQEFPSSVNDAVSISQKIERPPETPMNSNSMVIDAPEVIQFTEGIESTFRVAGRLLGFEANQTLKLVNAPEGMSFNSTTGEVRWTPPTTFITGTQTSAKSVLHVDLVVTREEETMTVRKDIVLFVKVASPPLSQNALTLVTTPLTPHFVEGQLGSFKLAGRLLGGAKGTLSVEVVNLPEGAKAKTLSAGEVEVSWTPPFDTVTGQDHSTHYPLEVRLKARDSEGEVSKTETISLNVRIASPPLTQNSLALVTTPVAPQFVEGKAGSFKLAGKILGGAKGTLSVEVLNLPKGAQKKNLSSGEVEVSWTPPFDTVTGNNHAASYSLQVKVSARGDEGEVSKTQTIPLNVRVASPPLKSDSLAIVSAPTVPHFVEGKAGSFKLAGKILGGAKGALSVEVLNLPKGAQKKNLSSGEVEVSWTPPFDTVTGDNHAASYALEVKVSARGEEGVVSKTETISLNVSIASPPLKSDSLAIVSAPTVPRFVEGKAGSFKLAGKILGGAKGTLSVEVLNLPKGAQKKNLSSGEVEVSWTPPFDTITGRDYATSYDLEVKVSARGEEGVVSKTETISLSVRVASPPLNKDSLVIMVAPTVPRFVEGKAGSFKLTGKILGGAKGTLSMELVNLPKGAQKKTLSSGEVEVSWTPPFDTVTGSDYATSHDLEVKVSARGEEGVVNKTETIPLNVRVASPPLNEDSLAIITVPTVPLFVEGKSGSFKLAGKIMGGAKGTLSVEVVNLPKGAKAKTLSNGQIEVSWTPPFDTVTGSDYSSSYPLEVRLTARNPEGTVTKTERLPLNVRIASPPLSEDSLVLVATPASPQFVEGKSGSFKLSGKIMGGAAGTLSVKAVNLPKGAKVKTLSSGEVEVSWTPSFDTVTGTDHFSNYSLQVNLTARNAEGEVSKTETLSLNVRADSLPLSKEGLALKVEPAIPHFIEERKGSFTLTGEILGGLKGTTKIKIINLPQGAEQERLSSGKVKVTWTPPASTITGEKEFSTSYPLEVELRGQSNGGGEEFKVTRIVPLSVTVAHPPLDADLIFIDVEPQVVNLKEGKSNSFKISGRVFRQEKATQKVRIVNLPKGAQEKAVAGGIEVSWTPPYGTVPNDRFLTKYPLKVELQVSVEEQVVKKEFSVPVWIHTDIEQVPVVESVTFTKSPLPENEETQMVITILDRSNAAPSLHFFPVAKGDANGIYYVNFEDGKGVPVEGSTSRWRYKVGIDLRSRNVTKKDYADLKVGLKAYSRYGVSSAPYPFTYRVLNRVTNPSSSWDTDPRIPYGKEFQISFSVYDPRSEGIVTTDFEEACKKHLIKNYRCKCKVPSGENGRRQKCDLEWFAFKGAPSSIEFNFKVRNTNRGDSTDFREISVVRKIKLFQKR